MNKFLTTLAIIITLSLFGCSENTTGPTVDPKTGTYLVLTNNLNDTIMSFENIVNKNITLTKAPYWDNGMDKNTTTNEVFRYTEDENPLYPSIYTDSLGNEFMLRSFFIATYNKIKYLGDLDLLSYDERSEIVMWMMSVEAYIPSDID